MVKRFFKKLFAHQGGFTLVEVTATVVILSVIGMAVLNVTGKGNVLLARTSNEMDSRASARAILTRMVKDIEQAQATQVPPGQQAVQLMTYDSTVNQWYASRIYGFDASSKQVYVKDFSSYNDTTGKVTYLIKAISWVAYTPETTGINQADYINMSVTVSVGSSEMTFSATATCRSVNTKSTPIPEISFVSPNPALFQSLANGSMAIQITGNNTHFSTDTEVVLVRKGVTFDPKNFVPTGQDIVDYRNDPTKRNGSKASIVTIPTGSNGVILRFNLNQNDVANDTYDVYAMTARTFSNGNSSTEIAFKRQALAVGIEPNYLATVTTPSPDNPNDSTWNSYSWVLDRGTGGFGTMNTTTKSISKLENSNAKICYYTKPVQNFDYQVLITGVPSADAKHDGKSQALLTMFYDPEKDTYMSFGIDSTSAYFIPQVGAAPIKIPNVTVTNGQATLRAKTYWDDSMKRFRLKLWVNNVSDSSTPAMIVDNVPSDPVNGITPLCLGITTPDHIGPTFTMTR